jgi:hypothetical protein
MVASATFRRQLKEFLRRRGYELRRLDDLTFLADSFGSDKGTLSSGHKYTRIYDRMFRPMRDQRITLLEIGLLRADADRRRHTNAAEGATTTAAARAPSLEMWRRYFPAADIFGFDIDDFGSVQIAGCRIVRGDMSSRDDLMRVAQTIGGPIDIVIDDGSHVSHHQQIALAILFPQLRSGGSYIIEDLHWQDHHFEVKDAPKTKDVLRQFQVASTFESPFWSAEERRYLERNVDRVQLFDSLSDEGPDMTDALGVLIKR